MRDAQEAAREVGEAAREAHEHSDSRPRRRGRPPAAHARS
jgi:hypothetical protein